MSHNYNIMYEDEHLMVVDKASGMLVIPTPKGETNTLTDLLNEEITGRGPGQAKAHPCHRLDRETSGLIIYAKGKKAQALMMEEFKKRAVKKVYVAFVHGALKKNADTLRSRIFNRNKGREDEAITKYKVIEAHKDFSVLEVEPVTGRTNQIRIQLKSIGHPLVGESVYAFRKDFKMKFKRVALHAQYLRFIHPVTKERLEFISPLPEEMEKLRRSA